MPDQNASWQWTSKLPALIIGLVLTIAGFLFSHSRWRGISVLGILMIALGLWAIIYSTTVQGWCAPSTAKFSSMSWGGGFFQGPSVYDCVRLVYPSVGIAR